MIGNKTISLIVPCKNEADIIGSFIHRVPECVDEIIIVDNNSTDDTATIAKKSGAIVVSEKRNIRGIGYGYAHQTGLAKATGDYIVAMDGDDTYPLSSIQTIVQYIERYDLDIVFCNRLPLMNKKAISWVRQLGIRILNLEARILYGIHIHDILTGMWIGRRTAVKDVFVTSGDWNYSMEIKLNAFTNASIRSSEYHIRHFERKHALSKQNLFRTGFHHALFLFRKRITSFVWNVQRPAFTN